MTRGQLFSIDFLISIVVLTAILGFSAHSLDLAQKTLASHGVYQSNAAEILASANASNSPVSTAPSHCITWRNSSQVFSDNCSSVIYGSPAKDFFNYCKSTTGNVFSGRRLVKCPTTNAACILEVRTCG